MSLVTDILERLSGIAIVREKLDDTTKRVDKVADWLLDHERRITTLEAKQSATKSGKTTKKKSGNR
jgi:DNA-binding MurR/RpiR family transcriptional regulator